MENTVLKVKDLSLTYFGGYDAVGDVSFELCAGEKLSVFGGQNQGKTSLMRALAGLEEYSGSIQLCGKELRDIPPEERNVTYSFDENSLNPRQSVLKNIVRPLVLRNCDDAYIAARLSYVSELFGVGDLLNVKVKELTEVQLCRVLLARIFVRESKLYLLDNVFGKIDYYVRRTLFGLLYQAVFNSDAVVIYATDRIVEATTLGDKIAVIQGGRIEQIDDYYHLYKNPQSLSVLRGLDENLGLISGYLKKRENGYTVKMYDGEEISVNTLPIAENYQNKLVYACVYPKDVRAEKSDEGKWHVIAIVSTKDGNIALLKRDENMVCAEAKGLKRGDCAEVGIMRVGNYFDKLSERKINLDESDK